MDLFKPAPCCRKWWLSYGAFKATLHMLRTKLVGTGWQSFVEDLAPTYQWYQWCWAKGTTMVWGCRREESNGLRTGPQIRKKVSLHHKQLKTLTLLLVSYVVVEGQMNFALPRRGNLTLRIFSNHFHQLKRWSMTVCEHALPDPSQQGELLHGLALFAVGKFAWNVGKKVPLKLRNISEANTKQYGKHRRSTMDSGEEQPPTLDSGRCMTLLTSRIVRQKDFLFFSLVRIVT